MDKKIQDYINNQSSQQKDIVKEIRKIIISTFPQIKEELKMGVPWYQDMFYIVALKDHVNIGFCVDGLSNKDMSLLEGKGKFMRHMKIKSLNDIDENKIIYMLNAVRNRSSD